MPPFFIFLLKSNTLPIQTSAHLKAAHITRVGLSFGQRNEFRHQTSIRHHRQQNVYFNSLTLYLLFFFCLNIMHRAHTS
jgi:hypothetical protein